jgi:radical SAM protein with 4Fe4S-binding SPASM domain
MCRYVQNSIGTQITLQQYESILIQAKDLRSVTGISLSGNREGLLHTNFAELVLMTRNFGFNVRLSTNGLLLTHKIAKVLVKNCETVNISVTGLTPEVYFHFQGSCRTDCTVQFEHVVNNVAHLVHLRNKYGSKLKISVSYIVTPISVKQARESLFFWRNLGIDNIRFANDVNEITEKLNQSARSAIKYYPSSLCTEAPVISSSGEVFPCCLPTGEFMSLGNCFETPLKEIFSSDKYYEFYKQLAQLNPDTLPAGCKSCGVIGSTNMR